MNWILPTPRGVFFSLAAVGGIGVALINVGLGTALAAASLTGIVLSSFFIALFSLYFIKIERSPGRDGNRGSTLPMPLVITNHGIFFRQALVVSEKIPFAPGGLHRCAAPPLKPREKILFNRNVPIMRRGFFSLQNIVLIGGDPAGLFARRRTFKIPTEVMISPEIVELRDLPLQVQGRSILSPEGRPLGISGQGQEFFGIREYRPSDGLRFIDWKSTASKRKLMVKEFEAGSIDQITLMLDCEAKLTGRDREESNFEFLTKIAASIFHNMSELYCRVQFIGFDQNGKRIRVRGEASGVYQEVMDALSTIEPGKGKLTELLDEAPNLIYPDSIFYCLSMSENATIRKQLEELAANRIEVRWIFAPREYFPIIDPEQPRVIKKAVPEQSGGWLKPLTVNFNTKLREALCREQNN